MKKVTVPVIACSTLRRPRALFARRRSERSSAALKAPSTSAFEQYMAFGGTPVTRAQFEANMAAKLTDPAFLTDVPPLLRTGLEHDAAAAWARVHARLVSRLPGEPWKGDGDAR